MMHIFRPGMLCSIHRTLLLWLVPLFLLVGAGSATVSYLSFTRMVGEFMDEQMEQLGNSLARQDGVGGIRILRRGYTFTDGSDGQGHLDAGLFFLAFARDAHAQFVPMQKALARSDALNEYIEHTGSALFACPPGLGPDDDWGAQLFG